MVIQTIGLNKVINGCEILSHVDLEISAGECVAITGANGAGKTTLLRCLSSLVRPTSGRIQWCGRTLCDVRKVRRLIGYVAHDQQVYPRLTVRENLIFAARMNALPQPGRRADTLLHDVGLGAAANRPAARISRGMRQRLAIARAVIHDPSIILLDEPLTGLDSLGCNWLTGFIDQQRRLGRTVCLATHHTEFFGHLAERILHLHSGVIQTSPPQADRIRRHVA